MGVEPKIGGFYPPNHPFVHRVFHYFHHPFWVCSPAGTVANCCLDHRGIPWLRVRRFFFFSDLEVSCKKFCQAHQIVSNSIKSMFHPTMESQDGVQLLPVYTTSE